MSPPGTPYLRIDAATVRRNLKRYADYAAEHGLGLRPHTKTHKSVKVAGMQVAAGATGLTVAKAGEARAMAEACDDLFMAFPAVDAPRCEQLADLAQRVTMRVGIDTETAADALDQAARQADSTVGVLVDLDVGNRRTGVQSPDDALRLAQSVSSNKSLRLDGIMIYPGHVKGPPEKQTPALKQVEAILQATLDLWRKAGLAATIVSGGSTPSAMQSHLVDGLTEIRPGTYVYNDMTQVRGGYCALDDCAARIVCTVVSDAVPGQVILDAGGKTLTYDRCPPAPDSGHGHVVEYPEAVITKVSEEHGQVDVTACGQRPRVGEQVTVIPNHICPCVNLQDAAWWRENGSLERLPIDARGRLS